MKCKQCGREIPEAAIFCCWCGVKQLRERRKKGAIKVPKPRQLRSGARNIELREILPAAMAAADGGALVQGSLNTLYVQINRVCDAAGLARVGIHGLRRSFASLAYHLRWPELETMRVGGWSDYKTMRKIYTKLAERDKSAAVQKMEQFYSAEEQDEEAKKRS